VRKELAKAETRSSELERSLKEAEAALELEVEDTREEESALHAALADAIEIEERARREAEAAAAEASRIDQRRRTIQAIVEAANAIATDAGLAERGWRFRELPSAISELGEDTITRRAGLKILRDGPLYRIESADA
jgi:hypothetical protein